MPSTSPTCFFTEPWADVVLLPVVFFRLDSAPAVFFRAAVVRGAPSLRDLEDAVFFAKLPPLSRFEATSLHCTTPPCTRVNDQFD